MEGEREEEGECTQCGKTSTPVDTLTQNCSGESNESHELHVAEEDDQDDSGTYDEEAEPSQVCWGGQQDVCISDTATLPQETLTARNPQDDADCLPLSPLPTEEEATPSLSSHSSSTQNRSSEPCWYCLRSLDSQYRPQAPKKQDSDPLSPLPSSGRKVSYQTDPRPHFGVACSSHSTRLPLWGSEGPCWGHRNQELPDQTHTCPHCHLGLPPDTLRWHEAKCLLFDGLRNLKK